MPEKKTVIPGLTGNLPLVKYSLCFREYFFYTRWRSPNWSGMTSLVNLFNAFLSSIRFGDIYKGGSERVVGDEGGGKADDGE